jgi:non-ribosomal peptide synthetase component F
MHGQAEATGVVATYLYQSSKDIGNIVPIGQPLPGLKLYLLDPALQPVSPMACVEIYSPGERIAQPFI